MPIPIEAVTTESRLRDALRDLLERLGAVSLFDLATDDTLIGAARAFEVWDGITRVEAPREEELTF